MWSNTRISSTILQLIAKTNPFKFTREKQVYWRQYESRCSQKPKQTAIGKPNKSVQSPKLCKNCFPTQNFTEIGQSSAELWSKRCLKWRPSAVLNFKSPIMGSLKSLCRTSYRSSIKTIALNCLVFEKIAFCTHFGNRLTDKRRDGLQEHVNPLLTIAINRLLKKRSTILKDPTELRTNFSNLKILKYL